MYSLIHEHQHCRRFALHMCVHGQSQRCMLSPNTQPCDNCLCHLKAVSPKPMPPMPMQKMRFTVLTSFMATDQMSLTNIQWFATRNEPNCLICFVYNSNRDKIHLSQCCPMLLQSHQCFKCLGQHPRVNCQNVIPMSHDNYPTCYLVHTDPSLGNVPLHKRKYSLDCEGWLQS